MTLSIQGTTTIALAFHTNTDKRREARGTRLETAFEIATAHPELAANSKAITCWISSTVNAAK